MKLKEKRLVPFCTAILARIDQYENLSAQIKEWCESDSFNPVGRVYLADCDRKKVKMFSVENRKVSAFEDDYTFFALIRFIQKAKPSCIIDFCNNTLSKTVVFFSHAGSAVCQRSLFSLFFAEAGYKKAFANDLKKAVPCFFNESKPGERFVYRQTSDSEIPKEFEEPTENQIQKEEKLVLDLGALPENPTSRILWVPKRTTARGMWGDF